MDKLIHRSGQRRKEQVLLLAGGAQQTVLQVADSDFVLESELERGGCIWRWTRWTIDFIMNTATNKKDEGKDQSDNNDCDREIEI